MAEKISKLEKIKELVKNTFPNDGEWSIVKLELQKDRRDYEHKVVASFNSLEDERKSAVLNLVCQGKYFEEQIAYLRLTEDLSAGFALTEDSFCFFYKQKCENHFYEKISTDNSADIAFLFSMNGDYRLFDELCYSDWEDIKKFLDVVKNF